MKVKLVWVLVLSFHFYSCTTKKGMINESDYFEGKIYYSIEYSNIHSVFGDINLEEFLGNKAILSYKQGNYKKEFYNATELVMVTYRNKEERRFYMEELDSDTIDYYYTNNSEYKTTIDLSSIENILNYDCVKVLSYSTPKDMNSLETDISCKIYIAKDLKVDPQWYVDYIDGSQDEIYKSVPGLPLREIKTSKNYHSNQVAYKVERVKISNEELKLPNSKILNEFE